MNGQPHHALSFFPPLIIYLAMPGINCGTQDLSLLWHARFVVAACELLVVACGVFAVAHALSSWGAWALWLRSVGSVVATRA